MLNKTWEIVVAVVLVYVILATICDDFLYFTIGRNREFKPKWTQISTVVKETRQCPTKGFLSIHGNLWA